MSGGLLGDVTVNGESSCEDDTIDSLDVPAGVDLKMDFCEAGLSDGRELGSGVVGGGGSS